MCGPTTSLGGRAAVAAGALYRPIPSSDCSGGKWKPKKPLTAGLYVVPCGVQISGSDYAGNVTIAAAGEIKLSGSGHTLTPFSDGLMFFSDATARGRSTCRVAPVLRRVDDRPAGGIEVSGSSHTLGCGVMRRRP